MRLPNRELVRISLYWLGLSSIFAGLSFIMAGRLEFTGLADKAGAGRALFLISISGAVIAVIVEFLPKTGTRWVDILLRAVICIATLPIAFFCLRIKPTIDGDDPGKQYPKK